MKDPDRLGDFEEIYEILVTSYGRRGGALPAEGDLCWRPATDVYETEAEYVVQMELAGMDPAGIELFTDGRNLTVRGIRQDVTASGKKHFHKMEINVGPFVRRITLGAKVDAHSAVAVYRAGFLYVTFRKGTPGSEGRRRIEVDR